MNYEIRPVEVVAYDPAWPQIFEQEASLLRQILGNHCIEVHHIGSTSVPGLSSKNKIDILCVVDELDYKLTPRLAAGTKQWGDCQGGRGAALPPWTSTGLYPVRSQKINSGLVLQDFEYEFKGELNTPLRYFFAKRTKLLKVNLNVVETGHGFIGLNLCFRDYLRAHEDACQAYADIKEQILNDPKSHERTNLKFPVYSLRKDRFIKSILEKAGFDGFVVNFCMHDREWKEYHRIREEQIFKPINIVYDRNHYTLTDPNNYHFVLYKGTKIVSAGQVELLSKTEAALRSIATDEPYRRNGYGAYLVRFLEKWIKHQGRIVVKTHARPSAENFYRKLGYSDMVFDDEGLAKECVDLGKRL